MYNRNSFLPLSEEELKKQQSSQQAQADSIKAYKNSPQYAQRMQTQSASRSARAANEGRWSAVNQGRLNNAAAAKSNANRLARANASRTARGAEAVEAGGDSAAAGGAAMAGQLALGEMNRSMQGQYGNTDTASSIGLNAGQYALAGAQFGWGGAAAGAVVGAGVGAMQASAARKAQRVAIHNQKMQDLMRIESERGVKVQNAITNMAQGIGTTLNDSTILRL